MLWFAFVKLVLTGAGLCVLVVCSRMRLFRRIPGEAFVYVVLGAYLWLIAYELRMSIGPLVSLIAGILILIVPRLLNYIVAIYLIIIGLLGLFGR